MVRTTGPTNRQRQQLLTLALLATDAPLTLGQLQQKALVSRTTIIKDLKIDEPWLAQQGIELERRPNYGIHGKGSERARRQALTHLLWEETERPDPLIKLTLFDGLKLNLSHASSQPAIINDALELIRKWDTSRTLPLVTEAEAQLGGRFSDDAVLYLALVLAVQAERIQSGHTIEVAADTLNWLRSLELWSIAKRMTSQLGWYWPAKWSDHEVAWAGMHLLAAPRNEGWPSDSSISSAYVPLVDDMLQHIAALYGIPRLSRDQTLRDGIVNHIVPACLRQQFDLSMAPVLPHVVLSSDYASETAAIERLLPLIQNRTGITLPEREANSLALLMRAAYIRECQDTERHVIVVCPSGMATAQLLVARLKVYFPRFGSYRVVSLRELGKEPLAPQQLIITTIPLSEELRKRATVIQVHPLLLPTDVEQITRALA